MTIEVATGDIAWTYFTEGPVRSAPAVADKYLTDMRRVLPNLVFRTIPT
jgi:hypothetical protein